MNELKNRAHHFAACKKPTSLTKMHKLKVKGYKKIFHAKEKGKKAGQAIPISDKIDFNTKT